MATNFAPVLRFSFGGTSLADSNSVALDKILPESKDISPGTSIHVQAMIHNRGVKNLTSCTINWIFNGITQPPVLWQGDLPEDHIALDTLYTYTPVMVGEKDVIKAWVSMPNGETDMTNDDDTLVVEIIVCGSGMKGQYIIGTSTSADYSSISEAFTAIQTCGIDGKVILALEDGIYNQTTVLNMGILNDYIDITDTVVLTSVSGNAAAVTLKTSTAGGIRFNLIRNIIIQDLTIDAINGTSAIEFVSECTNIVIRDCHLLSDSTGTAVNKYVLYKGLLGTLNMSDIYIIHNIINGGYHGIYFEPGFDLSTFSTIHNGRITIDSNTVSNSYNRAIYADGIIHCNHNTILTRKTNISGEWTGIYTSQGADTRITGNRIIQRCANIGTPYGVLPLYPYPSSNSTDTAIIANNEIILSTSDSARGIVFVQAKILNNSIHISGTGKSYGIYADNRLMSIGEIKNNNIVMLGNKSTPFYSSAATTIPLMDIDYNNTYNPSNIMCSGTPLLFLKLWKTTILTDVHSTRILPDFADETTSLKLASSANLFCPSIYPVNEDIDGIPREEITLKGCYGLPATTTNATLTSIEGIQEGLITGQTDSVKVVLYNMGTSPLTSVNMGWSINGIVQNSNFVLPLSLTQGQSATLGLGTITYPVKKVTVKIWINNLNGGVITDEYLLDDTITTSIYICQGAFNGLLTIGETGDFQSLTEAYNALELCGINGNVTLAFQNGTYTENLDFINSATLFSNYSLTLTSVSGNSYDVTFVSLSEASVHLNNTDNLILKNITVDARQGTYGIQFTGRASNITIDSCRILVNPTVSGTINNNNSTPPNSAGICKAVNTGLLDRLTVKNSIIDGGISGIYLYGDSVYYQNIIIDSNSMTNQSYSGNYLCNISANSISYNKITPRSSNSGVSWYALYGNYLRNGGNIIGNHISAINSSITTTLSGIYISNM
ncbi:MAG: hypothetical protein LBE13_20050, partial [Bacteroidales bacterium]|nr:hypothetical protein [Bacteroidales bacterium]